MRVIPMERLEVGMHGWLEDHYTGTVREVKLLSHGEAGWSLGIIGVLRDGMPDRLPRYYRHYNMPDEHGWRIWDEQPDSSVTVHWDGVRRK